MIAEADTERPGLFQGEGTPRDAPASKRRYFVLYWTAVCACSLAVHLTGYSLGVWCYEVTGSVTLYALFPLLVILPILLVSPFAGVLVDRMENRRYSLGLFSDPGKAGVFGFLWFLLGLSIAVRHGIGLRRPHLPGLDSEATSTEKVVS